MRILLYWAIIITGLTACASGPRAAHPAGSGKPDGVIPLQFETEVVAIFEDSRGRYWFGSQNEGVARFDGERLTHFTVNDGLTDNQVRSIHEDREGVIWFECATGLATYDGQTIRRHTERNYAAKDAWRMAPGDLWFKSDESTGFNEREGSPGVYRYDGRAMSYLAFPLADARADDWSYSVTAMAAGESGRRWFATYRAVIGYDGESFTIIDDERLGLTDETGRLHVRSVFEDSRGRVWIGNNWIGVFLLEDGTVTNFTKAWNVGRSTARHDEHRAQQRGDAPRGMPSLHRVFAIGEDRTGAIWFGTVEQGAWRFDGESLEQFTEQDGLTTAGVMAIYTDRDGDLWMGGHGVFKFNGVSFDQIH